MINNIEESLQDKTAEDNELSRLHAELAEKEKIIDAQREELAQLHERIRTDHIITGTKIHALEQTIHLLREQTVFDDLTGLYRRKPFEIKLHEEFSKIDLSQSVEHEERRKEDCIEHLSIIFLDVDRFKQINDTQGHNAGDQVLKTIATILKKNVRESDPVCRWGGEEMVVALPGASEDKAFEIAETMRIEIKNTDLCTVSVGVASYEKGIEATTLIKRADQAMYKAKHQPEGRDRVERYSDFTSEDFHRYQPAQK